MPKLDAIKFKVQLSDEFEELITVMGDMVKDLQKAFDLMVKIKDNAIPTEDGKENLMDEKKAGDIDEMKKVLVDFVKVLKEFLEAKLEKDTSTPSDQDTDQEDGSAKIPSKREILAWMVNWAKRVMTDPKDCPAISRPSPIEYSILPEMIIKIGEFYRSVKKNHPED